MIVSDFNHMNLNWNDKFWIILGHCFLNWATFLRLLRSHWLQTWPKRKNRNVKISTKIANFLLFWKIKFKFGRHCLLPRDFSKLPRPEDDQQCRPQRLDIYHKNGSNRFQGCEQIDQFFQFQRSSGDLARRCRKSGRAQKSSGQIRRKNSTNLLPERVSFALNLLQTFFS